MRSPRRTLLLLRQSPTDRRLLELLLRVFPTPCRLLEAGSHSGHLSALLAQLGYEVTLLDRLAEPLNLAKERFAEKRLEARFILGDILETSGSWDGVWNSGVVQAYPPGVRASLVQALCRMAPKTLFIYPDVTHPNFPRAFDPAVPPGIAGCMEYPAADLPELMARDCNVVRHGRLSPEAINLGYPFEYAIGERR